MKMGSTRQSVFGDIMLVSLFCQWGGSIMIFKESGIRNKPVIILLHGGGLSWWSLKPQIEALKKEFFIVTPIIDGHGDDWSHTFISIRKSADQVIDYIDANCGGQVFALYGLSLGAQIVVDILSRRREITENAVIESALVYPMKLATAATVPLYNLLYGLIRKRWYSRLQAKALFIPEESIESYFLDSSRMTKESLINITKSNGDFSLSPAIGDTEARILILVGGKELSVMKKSARLLHDTLPGSTLKIIEKSGHGEISLRHPERHTSLLRSFFTNALD
jgi:pimeloyl-ACP methyl ester carboxylesterase